MSGKTPRTENAKKAPQASLKDKRAAKREKTEGSSTKARKSR